MAKENDITKLSEIAKNIRKDIIEEVYNAKSGHPGGALSIADILTVLYFNQMNIDDLNDENRDRLILSKGHASAAIYAALAEKGLIDKEELKNFRKLGSKLQGHPDCKKLPGIEISTGSLGQGLSVACGMAIASKLKKQNNRIFCILGDGELQEGQIWEAAMAASKYELDNLCVIVDNNDLQIDGRIKDVMNPYPIDRKFESFGFTVFNTDGNDIESLIKVFETSKMIKKQPVAIIAKTVKGKGIKFMEDRPEWHGKAPNDDEYKKAMEDLK